MKPRTRNERRLQRNRAIGSAVFTEPNCQAIVDLSKKRRPPVLRTPSGQIGKENTSSLF